MSYIIEGWDQVDLNLTVGPYGVPVDPISIVLDFASTEPPPPPLPWSLPSLTVEYRAPLQRASYAGGVTVAPLTTARTADHGAGARWLLAAVADLSIGGRFEDADATDSDHAAAWGIAVGKHGDTVIPWGRPLPTDTRHRMPWGKAAGKDRGDYVSGWIMNTPFRDVTPSVAWFSVNLTGDVYDDSAAFRALLNTDTLTTVTLFGDSDPVTFEAPTEVELRFGFVPPRRPSVPHDLTVRVTARQATERDSDHRLPWGAGQSVWQDYNLPYPVEENEPDPEPGPEPPEIRTVYITMNTLQIADVATGSALDVQEAQLSTDIDSLSWRFSGTLYGQGSLSLVRPDSSGMKDISVTINGHSWVFSIERYTSDERFPTQKFRIEGVSRTQYMAAPFAPTRSYTNPIATTAAQAATAELQGTGFTLDWSTGGDRDLPDWPIPSGALSYREKSPAQVIAQIVKAAGGVMIPNRTEDAWTIQPRYPVPPWQWEEAAPDVIVYIGMVRSRSAQYEPAPAFDGCYVSGVNQGVAVEVQRQGSGGVNPMPDIYEELITDPQAAISRGRNELAATGNKVVETLAVIIPENAAPPGVITPGQLVKVQHDDSNEDYLALCLSSSIAVRRAGAAEIYQSVTLERTA